VRDARLARRFDRDRVPASAFDWESLLDYPRRPVAAEARVASGAPPVLAPSSSRGRFRAPELLDVGCWRAGVAIAVG